MRRQLRSRVAWKRRRIVTPGGKNVVKFKKSRPAYHVCPRCGAKLTTPRLTPVLIRKLTKVQRRPERRFPELCSYCSRLAIKEMMK